MDSFFLSCYIQIMENTQNFLENYKCEGEKLKIYQYPAPVLSKVAAPVETFDDELRLLCKDMLYTMYNAPGIGLAAPQIGKSIRLFVMDVDFTPEQVANSDGSESTILTNFNPRIFINPIIKNSQGEIIYEEGCLSLPGLYEKIKRFETITIEYQNMYGEKCSLDADDILAICIQHENDHLDGKVFIDRLSLIKKNLLKKKFLKTKKK